MFVGTSVYPTHADYLVCSGRAFTCWMSESTSPDVLLDKVIEDHQGNFVLLWGVNGKQPVTAAWWCALDELGIVAPEPDWERKKFLTASAGSHSRGDKLRLGVADQELGLQTGKDPDDGWDVIDKYDSRFGAGMLRFVKRAAAKGIYTAILYATARPEWSNRLKEAGGFYLGYNYGERYSSLLGDPLSAGKDLKSVTLRDLADGLLKMVREHVDERHAAGWGNVMATSASFHVDYEIAAGADIPVIEDFAFSDLNLASALSRGLYRQYDLPLWGSHMAHEHYSWVPYSCEHKFDLLRSAMMLKYMSGCKLIVNESGNWHLEASLCVDSPMHETPRVELGNIGITDPYRGAPYVKEARKHYDKINYGSPFCRRYRQAISDFYAFVEANGTPEGQPETTVAVAKGNLDLSGGGHNTNSAIGGAFALADLNVAWFEGAPERGWEIVQKVFFPRPRIMAPYHNRFLSGTPHGMVDIVSFAQDQISAAFLSENYRALLFSGWNTASEKQYSILKEYVERGGRLFISIPHLSTNVTRNYTSYGVDELVRCGDFADLCGVKVRGRGRRFYWATAPERTGVLGFGLPRRFGIFTTCLGDIEICDPKMEVLAVEDEEMYPLLLRRHCGKGEVFFLNSWAYPGALDVDFGPGSVVDSKGLIGAVYQYIARLSRGRVWITDDQETPGAECEYIAYSYFPQARKICLFNVDFEQTHRCFLHHFGSTNQVELGPSQFIALDSAG
jgi:hypothetical protein